MSSLFHSIAEAFKGAISSVGLDLRVSQWSSQDSGDTVRLMAYDGIPSEEPNGTTIAINREPSGLDDLVAVWYAGGTWAYVDLGGAGTAITDGSNWYTTDTLQGVADGVVAAIGGTDQGTRTYSVENLVTSDETLVDSIEALDVGVGSLGAGVIWPMGVYGTWAVDGDGAETNGAGLVGATPTLTELGATYAKAEDDGVFADLSATSAEAGYTADYQPFPDSPVAETDYFYIGHSVPFAEVAAGFGTPGVYDSTAVIEWFYWNGAAWSALTIAYDGSEATAQDGSEWGERDGAFSFVPPADWAASTVDGQEAYWIRAGIASGKAANLTTVHVLSEEPQIVTPTDGFVAPHNGTVTAVRLNDGATTLHTTADVKFVLINYTTGAHSGELTFGQDQRTDRWTGLTLTVSAGDVLGVLCTQEDGTAEPSNVLLELTVNP